MAEQKVFLFHDNDWKAGLVSKSGKVLVSPKFKEYTQEGNSLYIGGKKKNIYYDLADEECKATEVSMETYLSSHQVFSDGLIKVESMSTRNTGFVNLAGEEVVPCVYSDAKTFCEGLCAVKKDGLWGYIDTEGKEVIPIKYKDAKDFNNGLAIVRETDKFSVIDKQGNEVIAAKYDFIANRATDVQSPRYTPKFINLDNAFIVNVDNKIGLVDLQGNELLAADYDKIYYSKKIVNDDFLILVKDNKLGACSLDGKVYLPCEYDDVDTVRRNPCNWTLHVELTPGFQSFKAWFVKKDGLWGVILESKEYIPCKYEKLVYMGGSVFAFKQGEMYGIIKDGNEVIPAVYSDFDGFYDGLARVKKDGLYGYIDINAKETIAPVYETAANFENGYAIVGKDGKKGIIDASGIFVCPCQYAHIYNEIPGLYSAKLNEDSAMCVMDVQGNVVIEAGKFFHKVGNLIKEESNDGLLGLRNAQGDVIAPCEYEDVKEPYYGIEVKKNGLYGLLTFDGETILPAEYDEIELPQGTNDIIVAKQGRKWLAFDKSGKPMIAPKAKKK